MTQPDRKDGGIEVPERWAECYGNAMCLDPLHVDMLIRELGTTEKLVRELMHERDLLSSALTCKNETIIELETKNELLERRALIAELAFKRIFHGHFGHNRSQRYLDWCTEQLIAEGTIQPIQQEGGSDTPKSSHHQFKTVRHISELTDPKYQKEK